MFATSDSFSEVIAHFIGYLQVEVDAMRIRQGFDEFHHFAPAPEAEHPLIQIDPAFAQRLDLQSYIPDIEYKPEAVYEQLQAYLSRIKVQVPHIGQPEIQWTPQHEAPFYPLPHSGSPAPLPLGPMPGSTILYVEQTRVLFDDDRIVTGNPDFEVHHPALTSSLVDGLASEALAVSAPLTELGPVRSVEAIDDFISGAHEQISLIGDTHEDGLLTIAAPTIEGHFVNGEVVAGDLPQLEDLLPAHLKPAVFGDEPDDSSDASQPSVEVEILGQDIAPTVQVDAGGNLLFNEVSIVNAGLASTFFGVAGDYHSINAIIQTNAYCDTDTIDPAFPGVSAMLSGTTVAYNIAGFEHETRDTAAATAAANPDLLPTSWHVSMIQGDLIFFDWVSQYSFTSDMDSHVLTASGSTTTITTGENLGVDQVSFSDLGRLYDVIIIGGNLYDANIICQTNVLYDNDTLQLLTPVSGAGGSSVSTSGNLLWNQANILNVGATDWQSGLPSAYGDTISGLQSGNYALPASYAADPSFQGYGDLSVLYVAGNIFDVHYIEQVNILADGDYLALYEQNLTDARPDTEWDVSTGSNALVNIATIEDYDTVGTTGFVGGNQYSDSLLIQADIVDGGPALTLQSGDALVNEVIAFLDTDDAGLQTPSDYDHGAAVTSHTDAPPLDVVQSMVA